MDRDSFLYKLSDEFLASIDFWSLVAMAENSPSPDSRNPARSSNSWNIIRLVCYRYNKQHCEDFFRDHRLYKLFLAVYSQEELTESLHSDDLYLHELKYLLRQA